MARILNINHVTLIVDDLEKNAKFYEEEFGLEPLPAFQFDYPVMFYKLTEDQQLHLTEWEDAASFRGHVCFKVDDFNTVFKRMKGMDAIDIQPWGKVRKLPDGAMQMFVRDPAGNLIEISSMPGADIDPSIFEDELYADGIYVSGRNDFRGFKSDTATLYHGGKE